MDSFSVGMTAQRTNADDRHRLIHDNIITVADTKHAPIGKNRLEAPTDDYWGTTNVVLSFPICSSYLGGTFDSIVKSSIGTYALAMSDIDPPFDKHRKVRSENHLNSIDCAERTIMLLIPIVLPESS